MERAPERPVLFFDGDCGLCARSVRFVLDHERDRELRFAPLQSPLGREAAARAGLDPGRLETIVLIDERGAVTTRSTAALHVARHLALPWRLLRVGWIVPRFLRDALYDFVAKRRARWFGQGDACSLLSREDASRLLDGELGGASGPPHSAAPGRRT